MLIEPMLQHLRHEKKRVNGRLSSTVGYAGRILDSEEAGQRGRLWSLSLCTHLKTTALPPSLREGREATPVLTVPVRRRTLPSLSLDPPEGRVK